MWPAIEHEVMRYWQGMCGSEQVLIAVRLSPSDRLYLTKAEADRLAETIRQELVCRTTAQTDDLVMVADAPLTAAEAWRLIDRFVPIEDEVDWQTEGF